MERELSAGVQGCVLLLRNEESGAQVVFKHYTKTEQSSTRFPKDSDPYWSLLNETDFLRHLDVVTRVVATTEHLRERDLLRFEGGFPHYKGIRIPPDRLVSLAATRSGGPIAREFAQTPLIEDFARYVIDDHSGAEFLPLREPPGMIGLRVALDDPDTGDVELAPLCTYFEGQPLEEYVARDLSGSTRRAVAYSLLEAVLCIHRHGIMHRDLKPGNLIVGPNAQVRLIDFGIAQYFAPSDRVAELAGCLNLPPPKNQLLESNFTSRDWFGSRLFSPPESKPARASSEDDVFAAGLLASTVLTGSHPYMCSPSFRDYLGASREAQTGISRAYQSFLETNFSTEVGQHSLQNMFELYLDKHRSIELERVAPTFAPVPSQRVRRMCALLPHTKDRFPPIYDTAGFYEGAGTDQEPQWFRKQYSAELDRKAGFFSCVRVRSFGADVGSRVRWEHASDEPGTRVVERILDQLLSQQREVGEIPPLDWTY